MRTYEIGTKLKNEDLTSMSPMNDPEILDQLEEHNMLPEGVSAATLKFIFFIFGNPQIKWEDFSQRPDLNVNGCPGLPTPMSLVFDKGHETALEFLLAMARLRKNNR